MTQADNRHPEFSNYIYFPEPTDIMVIIALYDKDHAPSQEDRGSKLFLLYNREVVRHALIKASKK